jgi:hypothetical protein
LRPQIARKGVGAVDLGGTRRDAVTSEGGDRLAQPVKILAEPEIKTCPGIGDYGNPSASLASQDY